MQVVSRYTLPFAATPASTRSAKAPVRPPVVVETQPLQVKAEKSSGIWETGSFSFRDVLDMINPLQHIPVISTIYRKMTGDEMGYASRIAGDALYGGAIGSLVSSLVSAVANVFVDATTGKDIGEHLMAAVEPARVPEAVRAQHRVPVAGGYEAALTVAVSGQQPVVKDAAVARTQVHARRSVQADTLPATTAIIMPDLSRSQAAIDAYKWQQIKDDVREKKTGYWG